MTFYKRNLYGPVSTQTLFKDIFERANRFHDFCIIGKIIPVHHPIVTEAPLVKFPVWHKWRKISFSVSKIVDIISFIIWTKSILKVWCGVAI